MRTRAALLMLAVVLAVFVILVATQSGDAPVAVDAPVVEGEAQRTDGGDLDAPLVSRDASEETDEREALDAASPPGLLVNPVSPDVVYPEPSGPATLCSLSVVDATSGSPIEGAFVARTTVLRADFALRDGPPGVDAGFTPPTDGWYTDAEGRVDVAAREDRRRVTAVYAPGYGIAHVRHEWCDEPATAPYLVHLERAARLSGRVLGLDYGREARVRVVIDSASLRPKNDPTRRRAPHVRRFSDVAETWTCRLDEAGRFELRELPARVEFAVEVVGLSDDGEPWTLDRLTLFPGEEREAVWDVRDYGAIAGVVTLPDGTPVRHRTVRLLAGTHPTMVRTGNAPTLVTRTGSDGRFAFHAVRPGDYTVGVTEEPPPAHVQLSVIDLTGFDSGRPTPILPRGLASLGVPVSVRLGEPEVDARVVAHAGIFLRGRVECESGRLSRLSLNATGAPLGGTVVSAHLSVAPETPPEEAGRFELGPLVPGEYELTVFEPLFSTGFVVPDPLTVRAPADDIVVRLVDCDVEPGPR